MPPPSDCPPEQAARWPRPLRSAARLFGVEGLKPKELRQLRQGSAFFLQNVEVMIESFGAGSLYIGEHPALPDDPARASIWSSLIIALLRQHGSFDLNHIAQWRWGAQAVKPAGLLAIGMPTFMRSMWQRCCPDASRPSTSAIGKDLSGAFRTSQFKEYPEALSRAFAGALTDRFSFAEANGLLREVAIRCKVGPGRCCSL